jgi:hypothetical protein
MKLERLSSETQEGLRQWARWMHDDELLFDGIGSQPEHWAWICFQLRVAEDRAQWFPKGKWATIQVIEEFLYEEAKQLRPARAA